MIRATVVLGSYEKKNAVNDGNGNVSDNENDTK